MHLRNCPWTQKVAAGVFSIDAHILVFCVFFSWFQLNIFNLYKSTKYNRTKKKNKILHSPCSFGKIWQNCGRLWFVFPALYLLNFSGCLIFFAHLPNMIEALIILCARLISTKSLASMAFFSFLKKLLVFSSFQFTSFYQIFFQVFNGFLCR